MWVGWMDKSRVGPRVGMRVEYWADERAARLEVWMVAWMEYALVEMRVE